MHKQLMQLFDHAQTTNVSSYTNNSYNKPPSTILSKKPTVQIRCVNEKLWVDRTGRQLNELCSTLAYFTFGNNGDWRASLDKADLNGASKAFADF
eukprot:CAMPEP_0113864326 /NCGR_PEP_ID=MMETSP0372-20130328/17184_1 /TAXON_ID=340204 /ORGANISM="Lankesteria abbotti" /LENGTH=94 /DNA_ID=CAMNT_0000847335 /DNA_START=251 /DNA_END=533 /DNA_ORIENTATION=+ /assembly_acc=CAM_ASM_000359